ncbi:MAG: methylase [Armatimonadota bacterium]
MEHAEYRRMFEAEDKYWWFVSRRRLALRLLQNYEFPDGPILDLGCGTGAAMIELEKVAPTTGLDMSDEALRLAQTRGLTRLVRGDAQALPWPRDSFAAVVTLDTLEHVPDDGLAMREIARVLRPGGLLIMNVPAFPFLWGPHDRALMHQRRYHRSEVVERLRAAGLEVARATYSVFLLFPLIAAQRLLNKGGSGRVTLPKVSDRRNSQLIALHEWEGSLLQRVRLPWGSSVTAVARKPST